MNISIEVKQFLLLDEMEKILKELAYQALQGNYVNLTTLNTETPKGLLSRSSFGEISSELHDQVKDCTRRMVARELANVGAYENEVRKAVISGNSYHNPQTCKQGTEEKRALDCNQISKDNLCIVLNCIAYTAKDNYGDNINIVTREIYQLMRRYSESANQIFSLFQESQNNMNETLQKLY